MAEFVANFNLNNNNLDASFDLSDGASFDALFEIYAGSVTWGNILGDITNQTDLQDALDLKASNERVDEIVEAFDDDIESINDSITELSGNLDDLENTVTNNYNELSSAIDSNHQAISNINSTIQSYGDIVSYNAADFATSVQGVLADTALQPNDNISELTNDVGYITSASLPIVNNNRITIQKNGSTVGDFTLNQPNDETINLSIPTTAADVGALPDTTTINDLTTTAQQEALNSGANTTNIGQISANAQAIQTETTNRENADSNLQSQIDAITAASDVTDIVGTYAELQAYDTTNLPNNSIIKVLQDESRDDETTYYRWVITGGVGAWVLIGEEGPYYTKSEADSTFVPQTRTINGQALSSNISLTASDIGALPDSTVIPTVNNATLTIQKNGTNVQSFTANASSDVTANITVPTDTSDLTNGAGFITAASLPTVNDGILTIQANGTTVGTFTANQAGNTTANIVVPDSATWGNITGTLSNQTDLQNALNTKADSSSIGNGTVTFTQGGVTKGTITMNQGGNTTIALEQGGGTITDVEVNGNSVVTDGVAEIDLTGYQEKLTAGTDLEIVNVGSQGLPNGYTLLEWVESSGLQSLSLGFSGNCTIEFTTQMAHVPTSNEVLLTSSAGASAGTWFGVNSDNTWSYSEISGSTKIDVVMNATAQGLNGTINGNAFSRNVPVAHGTWTLFNNIPPSGATTFPSFMKLFALKVTQNSTVIRNLIPCKNNNNVVGLYDTINSVFYFSTSGTQLIAGTVIPTGKVINFTNESGYTKNVGTVTSVNGVQPDSNGNVTLVTGGVTDVEVNGESVVTDGVAEIDLSNYQEKLTAGTDLEILNGSPLHNLPSGYTELEYVQSSGTQYLDTGVAFKDGIRVEVDFQYISLGGTAYTFGFNDYLGYLFFVANGVYTVNASQGKNYSASIYNKNHISATFNSTNNIPTITATIGNETKTFTRSNSGGSHYNLQIFTVSGITNYASTGRCYGVKVYDNDVLVMELVPAIRTPDNKVGMYDIVSNTFKTNSGTGNFIASAPAVEQTIINFTNDTGYITGINSTDVTTALGYTPYNATNPNGYTSNVGTVTSVNGTQPDGNGNVAITIPAVNNGTLTITQDGNTLGTFGANQSTNSTIDIPANGRNVGEIVESTIPLTDAGLHLLDGALISGSGSYSAFVDYIAGLVTDYPNLFDTEANWQSAVTQYGVCGKFVYDSVSDTVRLPKYGNQMWTGGGEVPVVGNGMALGLTDGTTTAALMYSNNLGISTYQNGYGSSVGSSATSNGISNKIASITTDTTKSGIIAQLSNITTSLDGYYYIVVATATKTDIQVDIDEIATDLNGKADRDGSNMVNSVKNFDGGWVHSMSYLINSTTSLAAQTSRSFDLSSYLPNDNYQYEVIVSITGTTSATSGQAFNTWFKSDIFTNTYSFVGTRVITRTSSSMNSGTTVAIPVGTGRSIAIYNGSTYAGSITELWLSGYRRIGTNQ